MESSESLEEELLLGIVSKSKTLDGLGSVGGTSVDSGGSVVESSGGALDNSVSLVVGLVSNSEDVFSSESLLGLGLGSFDVEANSRLVESVSSSVVESGKVKWISGETFSS